MAKGFNNPQKGNNPNQDKNINFSSFSDEAIIDEIDNLTLETLAHTRNIESVSRKMSELLSRKAEWVESDVKQYKNWATYLSTQQSIRSKKEERLNELEEEYANRASKVFKKFVENQEKKVKQAEYVFRQQEKQVRLAQQSEKQLQKDKQKQQAEKRARTKVFHDLEHQFNGNTPLAKAFYTRFVNKQGQISPTGQVVGAGMAATLQAQDRFIRKLVLSLAQLPIFQTLGRSLVQLGGVFALHGLSRFIGKDNTPLERLGGFLEMLGGGLLALVPTLATMFGHVAGEVLAQLVGKKLLANYYTKLLAGSSASAVAGSTTVATQVGTKTIQVATTGTSVGSQIVSRQSSKLGLIAKFSPILRGLGKLVPVLSSIASIGAGISNIRSGERKGLGYTQLAAGILFFLAPLFGPAAPFVAGLATIVQLVTSIIDMMGDRSKESKESKEKPPVLGFLEKEHKSPTYSKVTQDSLATYIPKTLVDVNKPQTWSKGTWDYHRYGDSSKQKLGIDIDSTKYTKEQLNTWASQGLYNLEALRGGNGIKIANTFERDAMAARKGSNILLSLAASRMRELGYNDLIITSALSSKKSIHGTGPTGHRGGQTFDFSGAGLTKSQALKYAADLKSTGLFSHAQAEYDRRTGQWHIDARLDDKSYEVLNQQAEKANSYKSPKQVNKAVTEQQKQAPGDSALNKIINDNLTLSNSIFGQANYGIPIGG